MAVNLKLKWSPGSICQFQVLEAELLLPKLPPGIKEQRNIISLHDILLYKKTTFLIMLNAISSFANLKFFSLLSLISIFKSLIL